MCGEERFVCEKGEKEKREREGERQNERFPYMQVKSSFRLTSYNKHSSFDLFLKKKEHLVPIPVLRRRETKLLIQSLTRYSLVIDLIV